MPDETTDQMEPEPLDVVLIVKRLGPDGSISADVATNGAVQATEVQTLIELGLKSWRKKIGLD